MRRIEALTGEAARLWLTDREDRLKETAAALKASPEEVPARVATLIEERRRLERELAEAKKALALGGGGKAEAAGPEQVGGHGFIGQVLDGMDPKACAAWSTRPRSGSARASSRWSRSMTAAPPSRSASPTISTPRRNAVDLVRKAVEAVGGQGGGGRPDMAQGGGPEGGKAAEALAAVREALGAETVTA